MIRVVLASLLGLVLAGCAPPELVGSLPQDKTPSARPALINSVAERQEARRLAQRFVDVVEAVEPVAERVCRERTRGMNCDFRIVIDNRPGLPPNAFQTVDVAGRPVIAFTLTLIASAENADELAFIMGHEAAHHISGHIARTRDAAQIGGEILSGIARRSGLDRDGQAVAARLGASVGARSFSQQFELEADRIGTEIAALAGYNPLIGAAFFDKIPDPGNQFFGTHPPNAQRVATVRQEARRFGF